MNMLVEKYAKKVALAESVYAKAHNGERMDVQKKTTVAKCLDNINGFMTTALNESVSATSVTQRSAMSDFKKFALAVTNVGIPNLIAFDLVEVSPMDSISGSVIYAKYVKGTAKGQSSVGDVTNSVFGLGTMDVNYTGNAVVETATANQTTTSFTAVAGAMVNPSTGVGYKYKVTAAADSSVTYADTLSGIQAGDHIAYIYNNEIVPQDVLPTLKVEFVAVPLHARARRIAVRWSQLAAYQAQHDYGFNMADGLAEQAVSQLSYEIDSEVVDMLAKAATSVNTIANFSKAQPVGVALSDHFAAFGAKIEEYKMAIYDRTKKFAPNFMVVASDVMPVMSFVPGFVPASISTINGPYLAGTVNGIKVFVSPMLASGEFFLGVNQGAMNAACGIYAPYMAIIPTMLTEMPDGMSQQGWATMYDCQVLNADLLVKGQIVA